MNQVVYIGKIQDVLFPGLLLNFLGFYLVIVEVVYLIAYFQAKNACSFLSFIGIVGLLFGIQTIQPLQGIAHLIPIHLQVQWSFCLEDYLKQIDNVNLNWSMGMVLLPCLVYPFVSGILFIEDGEVHVKRKFSLGF